VSRSRKGSKGAGYEYWGKRGTCDKETTKASERMERKEETLSSTKWVCEECGAINPTCSGQCHNCGAFPKESA
jgi:ribosomal protein L40E